MTDIHRRQYRDNLDFVEAGFSACWGNANDLAVASKTLIDQGLHAPGLSLAVLALEEIGKLCAMDGLLFARPEDHKSLRFGKSQRDHDTKLTMLAGLPLFIANLSQVDPRRANVQIYGHAMAISFNQLKNAGDVLLQLIKEEDFSGLNKWKQMGFYVSADRCGFQAPRQAVDCKIAEAANHYAWQAITMLDFVLKDGNLERYIAQARSIRSKLTESDHQALERAGQDLAQIFFGPDERSAEG